MQQVEWHKYFGAYLCMVCKAAKAPWELQCQIVHKSKAKTVPSPSSRFP